MKPYIQFSLFIDTHTCAECIPLPNINFNCDYWCTF